MSVHAAPAQAQHCTYFTVVTVDKLNNVKQGLSADGLRWFEKNLAKKYPGACYVAPVPSVPIIFYITVAPAVYHGTRVVQQSSTESNPISGTVTGQDGTTSQIDATERATTTSSTAVPYTVEYGIYTLSIERRRSDGTFQVEHRFQQKGLYNRLYGIPLGGRGHHPVHAIVEDAARWIDRGGLLDQTQGVLVADEMPRLAHPPERIWTYGTVLDVEATRRLIAREEDSSARAPRRGLVYAIQADSTVYLTEVVNGRQAARLKGYVGVMFRLDGDKLYILAEDGKERETQIVKKISSDRDLRARSIPGASPYGDSADTRNTNVEYGTPRGRVSVPVTSATGQAAGTRKSLLGSPMNNADVIKLKTAGLSDELIIGKIRASEANYRLEVDDLVELKKAGIPESVLAAMLEAAQR